MVWGGWLNYLPALEEEEPIMKKLIAMALLALALGAGLGTVIVDQSQATSGMPQCRGNSC
jgi:hypothetical protein